MTNINDIHQHNSHFPSEYGDFNSENIISVKGSKAKLLCKKHCHRRKHFRPVRISDPAAVSGVSVFSNTSFYSTSNYGARLGRRKKQELCTVQFQVPERCMYIVWNRQPKEKYVPINEYDVGEQYIWHDEIRDRLKQGRKSRFDSSFEEFDEINHAALTADLIEAIDKVERNYFMGICDGSVIKISDKIYVWRVDISHIEDEIIFGPPSKRKLSSVISSYLPRFSFRFWRRLLHLYNFLRRCNPSYNHHY